MIKTEKQKLSEIQFLTKCAFCVFVCVCLCTCLSMCFCVCLRGDPLHPAGGLPSFLGRGPAQAVPADQGWGL